MTVKWGQLEIFRSLYCLSLAASITYAIPAFRALYAGGASRYELPISWDIYLTVSVASVLISLVSAGLGLWPRVTLILSVIFLTTLAEPIFTIGVYPLLDLSFYILLGLWLSNWIYSPRKMAFPLNLLASDAPDMNFNVDRVALLAVQIPLAAVYFNAFLNKLRLSGIEWLDGTTLQTYLYTRAMALDSPWRIALASNQSFISALSLLDLIFQGGFIFSLFVPRLRIAFAVAGVAFHAMNYGLAGVNFLLFYLPAYLSFVNWQAIYERTLCLRKSDK